MTAWRPAAWTVGFFLLLVSAAHAESWVAFYEVRQDGNLLGAERVDFDFGKDGAYTVRTNGTVRQAEGAGQDTYKSLTELRARAQGEFQDYQREVYINDLPRKLVAEHDGRYFVVRVNTGQGSQDHKIEGSGTAVTVDVGIYGHLALLIRYAEFNNRLGREVPYINPSELTKGVAIVEDRGEAPAKTAQGYFKAHRYFLDLGDVGANAWTAPDGRIIRLEIPATGITVELQKYKGERAAEADPLRAKTDSVDRSAMKFQSPVIPGADKTIAINGILYRPKGVTAPLPAVVFLSDTGPQDGTGIDAVTHIDTHMGDLCAAVAEAGFAVLALDDRGTGLSEGDVANTTLAMRAADAKSAIDALSARSDVDKTRLAVMGLGEGANVAMRVARGGAVKGVVALAPSPVSMGRLAEEQARRRVDPLSPTAKEDLEDDPVVIALKKARESKEDFTVIGAKPVYLDVFRQWDALDPVADAKAVGVKMLHVAAGRDRQIPKELTDEFSRKLGKASGYTFKRFDDLDHFLIRGRGTLASYSDPDRVLDPDAVSYIVRWLAASI